MDADMPHDPFGPFPPEWQAAITQMGQTGGDIAGREAIKVQLQAWLMRDDLMHQQLQGRERIEREARSQAAEDVRAAAMLKHTKSLTRATWFLALATFALIAATIVAALIVKG